MDLADWCCMGANKPIHVDNTRAVEDAVFWLRGGSVTDLEQPSLDTSPFDR